jgi:hypothetical protein
MDSTPQTTPNHGPDGGRAKHAGYWVVGAIFALSTLLGTWFAVLLMNSEQHLWESQLQAQQAGPTVDAEGCVTFAMEWRKGCTAIESLCDSTIDPIVESCMEGGDRTAWCAEAAGHSGTTAFDFARCEARGVPWKKPAKGFWDRALFGGGRTTADRKACASAYRAAADWCEGRTVVEVL